jgi:hypothetical protein
MVRVASTTVPAATRDRRVAEGRDLIVRVAGGPQGQAVDVGRDITWPNHRS